MTVPRLLKIKFRSLCHDPIGVVVIGVNFEDLFGRFILED